MSPILRRLAVVGSAVVTMFFVVLILVASLPDGNGSESDENTVVCGAIRASSASNAEFQCDDGMCSKSSTECAEALDNVVAACNPRLWAAGEVSGKGKTRVAEGAGEGVRVLAAVDDVSAVTKDQTETTAKEFSECVQEASPMVIRARRVSMKVSTMFALLFTSAASAANPRRAVRECIVTPPEESATPEEAKKTAKAIKGCLESATFSTFGDQGEYSWPHMWNPKAVGAYNAVGTENYETYSSEGGAYWGTATSLAEPGAYLLAAASLLVGICSIAVSRARHPRPNESDTPGTELVAAAVAV